MFDGLEILSLKLFFDKGEFVGAATVRLSNGLTIYDCPIFDGQYGLVVTAPRRRTTGGRYKPILTWRTREDGGTFSRAVLDALRASYPDAFSRINADEGKVRSLSLAEPSAREARHV
jgi:DNA-binding cell septation regulator SpoVG